MGRILSGVHCPSLLCYEWALLQTEYSCLNGRRYSACNSAVKVFIHKPFSFTLLHSSEVWPKMFTKYWPVKTVTTQVTVLIMCWHVCVHNILTSHCAHNVLTSCNMLTSQCSQYAGMYRSVFTICWQVCVHNMLTCLCSQYVDMSVFAICWHVCVYNMLTSHCAQNVLTSHNMLTSQCSQFADQSRHLHYADKSVLFIP